MSIESKIISETNVRDLFTYINESGAEEYFSIGIETNRVSYYVPNGARNDQPQFHIETPSKGGELEKAFLEASKWILAHMDESILPKTADPQDFLSNFLQEYLHTNLDNYLSSIPSTSKQSFISLIKTIQESPPTSDSSPQTLEPDQGSQSSPYSTAFQRIGKLAGKQVPEFVLELDDSLENTNLVMETEQLFRKCEVASRSMEVSVEEEYGDFFSEETLTEMAFLSK